MIKAAARPDSSTIQFIKSPIQGNSNYVILDTIGHDWKCGIWDWIQFIKLLKTFFSLSINLKLYQSRKNPTKFGLKTDPQGENESNSVKNG